MYPLVLFLLWSLCLNSATAQNSLRNKQVFKYNEELPYSILLCEFCGLKNQRIRSTFDRSYLKSLQSLKLFPSSQWDTEARALIDKQQESEYQIFGTKTWPAQIPFILSPLKEKNGLLVLMQSDKEILGKQLPKIARYILFYEGKVYIEASDKALENTLKEPEQNLENDDGIRFFIAKEVSGDQITALEKVIKNFTDDKNSLIIPYEVTADGIHYRSDIGVNHLMRAIKKINLVVPNLSAKKVHGMNDAIEITKIK